MGVRREKTRSRS